MKLLKAAGALLVSSSTLAANIEFAPVDMALIHSDQDKLALSYSQYSSDANGRYALDATGTPSASAGETGEVLKTEDLLQFFSHVSLSDDVSLSMQLYSPYALGSDLNSGFYQGTRANIDTQSLLTSLHYQLNEQFSGFFSASINQLEAQMVIGSGITSAEAQTLMGPHQVTLKQDLAVGWMAGASFHIPEIALRATLSYQSEVTHKTKATEIGDAILAATQSLPTPTDTLTGDAEFNLPKAVIFDFQTGIRETTLLTFNMQKRYWDDSRVLTQTGEALTFDDDANTYRLGLAEQVTPKLVAFAQFTYDEAVSDDINPLAPSNGYQSLMLAGTYAVADMNYGLGLEFGKTDNVTDPFGTEFKDNNVFGFSFLVEKTF